MDRDALIEGMAEAMSRDQLERRGQHIVPWSEEIHLWKEEQRARARAALAVAEPVVFCSECHTSADSAAAWNRRAPTPGAREAAEAMREAAARVVEAQRDSAQRTVDACQDDYARRHWAMCLAALNVVLPAIRALPLPASGWRPIATAPIDQEIDIWVARAANGDAYTHGYRQERVVWNATETYWEGERVVILPQQATAWMPFPAAPEGEEPAIAEPPR